MQQDVMFQGIPVFMGLMLVFAMVMALIVSGVTALVYCKVCAKAGYHWALGLLVLIPIANFVLPIYLAFADWPVRQELRALNQRLGQAPA